MRTILLFMLAVLALPTVARADLGDESLGINAHVPSNDLLDMSADLGVGWIRVDANWRDLHTGPGAYAWTEMDRVVDGARTRGLQVYMSMGYTPDWVPRVARSRSDTYRGNDEPASSTEWVAFVTAAVTRYRARGVTHFGIWNEPNLDGFWETAAGVEPYIDRILVPGAAAVRAACADCRVLGPDLAHVGDYDVFLNRVLTRASSSFDIFTHHIYSGWPETGIGVFDGDNFLNALEMRRFSFTRASMREVLDAHGWTGEVWITETGYRIRSASEEDDQATYVRRVMEEQLARSWWTNTFFYEITDCGVDDPSCTIDGFGITRPTRTGARTFPADYRLKPAYLEIRGFIDAHPEIVGMAMPARCGNGLDDDGDGRIDSLDRGCVDGVDDDESDDPARRALLATPAGSIAIDGDLAEWSTADLLDLGAADWRGVAPHGGDADLHVTARARFDAGALYLGFEVTDDVHVNADADALLWQSDSLQLAFDVARDYGDAYDSDDDHEINVALSRGAARVFRFQGPPGAPTDVEAAVVRTGTRVVYELRIPEGSLPPVTLRDATRIGFSFLVNDDDGATTTDGTGREGWIELTPGIGNGKRPYLFGELVLSDSGVLPDAGTRVDAAVATDGGGDVDAGVALDAALDRDGASADEDASGDDAGDGTDAGARRIAPSACACRAAGASEGRSALGLVGIGLVLSALARRRRRRVVPCLGGDRAVGAAPRSPA